MRIDGLGRTIAGGAQVAARPASPGAFSLAEPGSGEASRQAAALRPSPTLDALVALQAAAAESPRERRRREIARGRRLLEALDGLKFALLEGRAEPAEALSILARRAGERGEGSGEPGLDEALAAIDLRAKVELAKRGR